MYHRGEEILHHFTELESPCRLILMPVAPASGRDRFLVKNCWILLTIATKSRSNILGGCTQIRIQESINSNLQLKK
ncbi:MAG TPA: hypothetical protein DD001_22670 [Microcoleaceae bacterium UBA10368]|nr:hypothetical protein [Microcoleaceae cyanobacterium UBA11344]HBK99921.1 hypothetical protein [Microcoleaceae cyanobacterium UBA10368]HCV32998.1 hypothetical protein [Microcoleaceae cyanobacterium UBA9251]